MHTDPEKHPEQRAGEDGAHFEERRGHGRHGHTRDCNMHDGNDLSSLLRYCGHILYHRCGKKHGQDRIVRILSENGRMSQKELQSLLAVQSGSISEMISKLETKGLVRREKDEQDRRKIVIVITDEGKALADGAKKQAHSQTESYDALTAEEQETLRQLLKKLTDSWRPQHTAEQNHSSAPHSKMDNK